MQAIPCHSHSPLAYFARSRPARRPADLPAPQVCIFISLCPCLPLGPGVCTRAQVVKVESARSADQTGDSWFFIMASSCFSCSSRCRSRVGVGRARPRHARQNNTCMFAIYTHTTQDKDPYNMLPERVMTAHGIIRRCPTTTSFCWEHSPTGTHKRGFRRKLWECGCIRPYVPVVWVGG